MPGDRDPPSAVPPPGLPVRDGDRDRRHHAGTEPPRPRVLPAPPRPVGSGPVRPVPPASPPHPQPGSPAPPVSTGPVPPHPRIVPARFPAAPHRYRPQTWSEPPPTLRPDEPAGADGSGSRVPTRSLHGSPVSPRKAPRGSTLPRPLSPAPAPGARPLAPPFRTAPYRRASPGPPAPYAPARPGAAPPRGAALPAERSGPAGTCPAAAGCGGGTPSRAWGVPAPGARRGLEGWGWAGAEPRLGGGGEGWGVDPIPGAHLVISGMSLWGLSLEERGQAEIGGTPGGGGMEVGGGRWGDCARAASPTRGLAPTSSRCWAGSTQSVLGGSWVGARSGAPQAAPQCKGYTGSHWEAPRRRPGGASRRNVS